MVSSAPPPRNVLSRYGPASIGRFAPSPVTLENFSAVRTPPGSFLHNSALLFLLCREERRVSPFFFPLEISLLAMCASEHLPGIRSCFSPCFDPGLSLVFGRSFFMGCSFIRGCRFCTVLSEASLILFLFVTVPQGRSHPLSSCCFLFGERVFFFSATRYEVIRSSSSM